MEKEGDVSFNPTLEAPRTTHGDVLHASGFRSPAGLCCWKPFPTAADLTIDGVIYKWNSRAHRKLRIAQGAPSLHHPEKWQHRFRFLGWAPGIVTWWSIWIGEIANTLWVINGAFAVWPTLNSNSEQISYGTGVVGSFLFVVTGYLGFVEAINHSYTAVVLPTRKEKGSTTTARCFRRPAHIIYGQFPHPLFSQTEHVDYSKLLESGYPIVQDVASTKILTAPLFDQYLQNTTKYDPAFLRGRKVDILIGTNHVVHVTVDGLTSEAANNEALTNKETSKKKQKQSGYRWWTWDIDLRYMGILSAVVFFVSTIIFFIPACGWLPMDRHDKSVAEVVFWVQVTQIIACVGFIFSSHAWMAEASGSWWKPDFSNIGWWISFFNAIGSYGFMAYAVLAIPVTIQPDSYASLTKWGADLGTFWGSCAFWVAGLLQCIEFGSEHPIVFSFNKHV